MTYVHTCIHTYIQTQIHTYIQRGRKREAEMETIQPDRPTDSQPDRDSQTDRLAYIHIHTYIQTYRQAD